LDLLGRRGALGLSVLGKALDIATEDIDMDIRKEKAGSIGVGIGYWRMGVRIFLS